MAAQKVCTYALQGNYGESAGWEDLTYEDSWGEIRARYREYVENEPGTPLRIQRVYPSGRRVTTGCR